MTTTKTGILGGEDLIWVREAAAELVKDMPVSVTRTWMNRDKLVIELIYLELNEFCEFTEDGYPIGNDILIIARTVNTFLTSFLPYIKARLEKRNAEMRDLRKKSYVRLSDYNCYYMNQ